MKKKVDEFTSLREDYLKHPLKQEKILSLVEAIKNGAGFQCSTDKCFGVAKIAHGWCENCKKELAPVGYLKDGRRHLTIPQIQERLLQMGKEKYQRKIARARNEPNSKTVLAAGMNKPQMIQFFATT